MTDRCSTRCDHDSQCTNEKAWEVVHEMLDHRYLNDIEGLENPSTEVLAPFILNLLVDSLPLLERVKVYESSTTWCEVWR